MIWLSEIILQQTRVSQGLPYFMKFTKEFPTVFDLANASETKVLRLWQGLGYYSRARNLHACAKLVAEKYRGKFPNNYRDLLQLKGVGKYTASAIASFAFNQPVPVIDGNVYRVLSRVFGLADDIGSSRGQKVFTQLANQLMDREDPHNYNQAIMEFGAIHCTPSAPDCNTCIFMHDCHANKHGLQQDLPVKTKKVKVKSRFFHYLVIQHEGKVMMRQRKQKDIWKGLYDFYLIEDARPLAANQISRLKKPEWMAKHGLNLKSESSEYKHVLTHQRIFARFYRLETHAGLPVEILEESPDFRLYTLDEINHLPKSILIDNYLNEHIF